jgi:hypothetical protein
MKRMVLTGLLGALLLFELGGSLPAQTSATEYYVAVNGAKTGPYALDVLKQMAQNGTLTGNTQVWKAGMPEWVKAETVPEIAALLASAPAAYYVAVNGAKTGPYTLDVLKQMAQNGSLTGNTQVWKAGMPEWVKAGTVPEIAGLFTPGQRANVPGRDAGNVYVSTEGLYVSEDETFMLAFLPNKIGFAVRTGLSQATKFTWSSKAYKEDMGYTTLHFSNGTDITFISQINRDFIIGTDGSLFTFERTSYKGTFTYSDPFAFKSVVISDNNVSLIAGNNKILDSEIQRNGNQYRITIKLSNYTGDYYLFGRVLILYDKDVSEEKGFVFFKE